MQAPPIGEQEIEELFSWLDVMTFTRQKKNLSRDFSDGVLVAEIFKQYSPQLVQLHIYQPASSSSGKYMNWKSLNEKVCKKIGFQISRVDIENVIKMIPGTIERVLYYIFQCMRNSNYHQNNQNVKILPTTFRSEEDYSNRQLSEVLAGKQQTIRQLRDTIQILQAKMKKMDQLSRLKDAKIDSLLKKIEDQLIN